MKVCSFLILVFSFFIISSMMPVNAQVGIDVDPPLSKLHVNGGILSTGDTESTMTSGSGTRFMWIPARKALRAGEVSGDQWNDGNIGDYSFAFGYNSKASGNYAVSLGNNVTASGYNSFIAGQNVLASGDYSRCFGLHTTSQSYASVVTGRYNVIEGSTDSWVSTDPLFVIGNGTSDVLRNNAFTVLKNGNTTIDGKLEIDGNVDISGAYLQNSDTVLFVTASSTSIHLGADAGSSSTGANNTFLGYGAAFLNTSGHNNTVLGYGAGYYLDDGEYNTIMGSEAGFKNMQGGANTFIGANAGENNQTGNYNTYIGAMSGHNATGSHNVFLGYGAGYNETGSNKLHINNSTSGTPLIYGDFSLDRVGINTSSPQATLDVNGDVEADSFTGDGSGLTNLPVEDSYWTKASGVLYCDTLDIGLGTSNPDEQLHVSGKIKVEDNIMLNGNYLSNDGDNEGIFVDNSGNVGIGTTTPEEKLHIEGKIKLADNMVLNGNYLSGDGDNEGVHVDADGNVGIGTSTPSQQLEITGSFEMPNTSSSLTGVIFKGGSRFIHNYQNSGANGNNTFIGLNAGNFSMTGTSYQGSSNAGFGALSLQSLTSGFENTALGTNTLKSLTTGYENIAIGYNAMQNSVTTIRNVALGNYALRNSTGYENIAIGYFAADNITSGHNNIIIGADVDAMSATGNDQLNIGNTIYGDLNNDQIGIGIASPSATLHVNGSLKLESGTSVNEISTDTTMSGNSDQAVPTEKAVKKYVDRKIASQAYVPVGSVIAWAKDMTGVGALDTCYVECNGQTLSDPQSPLNGTTIPDLNGAQGGSTPRFLRGSGASGLAGGSETHVHHVSGVTDIPNIGANDLEPCTGTGCSSRAKNGHKHNLNLDTEAASTLPSYYEVVWIMRIK